MCQGVKNSVAHFCSCEVGEVSNIANVKDNSDSKQVRAGSRTYFIDVETSKEGQRYLKITESRFKGEDKERERATIIVFPEKAAELVDAIAAMVKRL